MTRRRSAKPDQSPEQSSPEGPLDAEALASILASDGDGLGTKGPSPFTDAHGDLDGPGGSGTGGSGGDDDGFRGRRVTTCSFCGKTSREVGPHGRGPQ